MTQDSYFLTENAGRMAFILTGRKARPLDTILLLHNEQPQRCWYFPNKFVLSSWTSQRECSSPGRPLFYNELIRVTPVWENVQMWRGAGLVLTVFYGIHP